MIVFPKSDDARLICTSLHNAYCEVNKKISDLRVELGKLEADKTTVGTGIFRFKHAAIKYYATYGETPETVESKISDGSITIAPYPANRRGEWDDDDRWHEPANLNRILAIENQIASEGHTLMGISTSLGAAENYLGIVLRCEAASQTTAEWTAQHHIRGHLTESWPHSPTHEIEWEEHERTVVLLCHGNSVPRGKSLVTPGKLMKVEQSKHNNRIIIFRRHGIEVPIACLRIIDPPHGNMWSFGARGTSYYGLHDGKWQHIPSIPKVIAFVKGSLKEPT